VLFPTISSWVPIWSSWDKNIIFSIIAYCSAKIFLPF